MIELTRDFIKTLFPKRPQISNKADFGKVLCITGSNKYIGAGYLSAMAALKVGAGYSFLCSEKSTIENYKKMSPDLIYTSHDDFDATLAIETVEKIKPSVIVLGCGIGFDEKKISFVDELLKYLKTQKIATILDADGLNCLSALNISNLGENFILTPHPKELSRLLKTDISDILENREATTLQAKEKYNSLIILKGHKTLIRNIETTLYMNTTGNNALAKAGTGDVLAGMIGGFIAQQQNMLNSACLAVYLHGFAADLYKTNFSEYSMLASDLLNYIPFAIKENLSHN